MSLHHIDVTKLGPDDFVRYKSDDALIIPFRHSIGGFGVHFGPFTLHDAWKLRSQNSAVGMETYVQSQRFSLDGVHYCLESAGNEVIEVNPAPNGYVLKVHAENPGRLRRSTSERQSYQAPAWAYDFWFATPENRVSEAEVLAEVQKAHAMRLHPTVWLLDAGWSSDVDFLQPAKRKFPSGVRVFRQLADQNIRPIVWMTPWIEAKTKLWNFFDQQGWFAKTSSGKSYIFPVVGNLTRRGSYIDFTLEDCLEYMGERIRQLIAEGVAGFKFDFGESLPDDARLAYETESAHMALAKGLVGHNWYVSETKRVMHELINNSDICLISRSGWTDSHQFTGLWLGDQSSDESFFAGLQSVVWGYYTAWQSGYRFIGMDIGGYFGQPSPAAYKRWLDLAICMPFSMHHGAFRANPWEAGEDGPTLHRAARKVHNLLWTNRHPDLSFQFDKSHQRLITIKADHHQFVVNERVSYK